MCVHAYGIGTDYTYISKKYIGKPCLVNWILIGFVAYPEYGTLILAFVLQMVFIHVSVDGSEFICSTHMVLLLVWMHVPLCVYFVLTLGSMAIRYLIDMCNMPIYEL